MAEECINGVCERREEVVVLKKSSEGTAVSSDEDTSMGVIVYHRHLCALCWMARWALWQAGVPFELKNIDSDYSWGEAMYRNGYRRGTFKLPVITHGCKAWWDIQDHKGLAEEIKGRLKREVANPDAAGM